jgi:hypothetical protein
LNLAGEAYQINTGERSEAYIAQPGYSTIMFYGYKTDGVWKSQAEIDAAKAAGYTSNITNAFVPGGLKIVDIDSNKILNSDDRTLIGNPFPDFTYGLTNVITYKNIDVSFTFQGVQGIDVRNGDLFYNETRRMNKNYNNGNRWLSAMFPGDGKTPYYTNGVDIMQTDYIIDDGSYYALRELVLGYTFPAKILKRASLNGLRFYCSIQNLYVHMAKGYRGIAPESRYTGGNYSSPLIDGYQRGGFPLPRTILFGLDINF